MSGKPLRRWKAIVSEQGSTRMALLYVMHRVLQRLSGDRAAIVPYLLVAQPVGNAALADVKADPHTVVRRIAPDDPVIDEFPRPREVNAQRFADGAECFVATVKGRFAGHIWIARRRYLEDEVRCAYEIAEPSTGVWDYDVYVEPHLRLGRTMARLWKGVDDTLAAEGVRWTFSRINRFNASSVRTHQRLGAMTMGSVVFVRLGRLEIASSPGKRWPQASLAGAGPSLLLPAPRGVTGG